MQIALLIGLGILGYGAMIYPPLTLVIALANLAFILACLGAYIVGRFTPNP
jgi:hypothetical protein